MTFAEEPVPEFSDFSPEGQSSTANGRSIEAEGLLLCRAKAFELDASAVFVRIHAK